MRVIIVSPYATVAPHFETELEIAQRHLDLGDQVDWLMCTGALANCDFNPHAILQRCEDCRLRRSHGISKLQPAIRPVHLLEKSIDTSFLLSLRNIEQLRELKLENFDIGYAVLSSLVSVIRDPEPNLIENMELLRALYASARATFEQTCEYISRKQIERVYVFNGRFANTRAVVRACEQQQVDCLIHERGSSLDQFELYVNHLPHEIAEIQKLIRGAWHRNPNEEQKKCVAHEWFANRRHRVEKNWISFTRDQTIGHLPIDWDSTQRNITIFTSSDDEFVAIGDQWKHTLFENQLEGLEAICKGLLRVSPDTRIFHRMHPNLIGVENEMKRRMLALKFPNLTTLEPEDPVDTYRLLEASDTVATFGSSVGIEATYWERPSVLLGPSLYRDLGGTHRPKTQEETIEMLASELVPLDKRGALQYGYWMNSHGIAFKYFKAESWYHGRFKDEVIYAKKEELKPLDKLRFLFAREGKPLRRAS